MASGSEGDHGNKARRDASVASKCAVRRLQPNPTFAQASTRAIFRTRNLAEFRFAAMRKSANREGTSPSRTRPRFREPAQAINGTRKRLDTRTKGPSSLLTRGSTVRDADRPSTSDITLGTHPYSRGVRQSVVRTNGGSPLPASERSATSHFSLQPRETIAQRPATRTDHGHRKNSCSDAGCCSRMALVSDGLGWIVLAHQQRPVLLTPRCGGTGSRLGLLAHVEFLTRMSRCLRPASSFDPSRPFWYAVVTAGAAVNVISAVASCRPAVTTGRRSSPEPADITTGLPLLAGRMRGAACAFWSRRTHTSLAAV
jgi:hypothetical protein